MFKSTCTLNRLSATVLASLSTAVCAQEQGQTLDTSCPFLQNQAESVKTVIELEKTIQDESKPAAARSAALQTREDLFEGCDDAHRRLIDQALNAGPSEESQIDLAKLTTNANWIAILESGLQLAPTYDENGQSSGFNEQSLFLALRFDGRHANSSGLFGGRFGPEIMRTGVDITFRQAPIVNESLGPTSSDSTDDGTTPDDGPVSVGDALTDLRFNDVDDSVIMNAYVSPQWTIGSSCIPKGSNIIDSGECVNFDGLLTSVGPFIAGGLTTRSDLIAISNPEDPPDGGGDRFTDDSVVSYYGFGLRFDVEDFTYHGNPGARNGLRRAYIQAGRFKLEDYAGQEDVWRWVIDAQYRLFTKIPIFVGLHANLSRSANNDTDDVAISVSYQFSAEDFLRRITP